MVLRIHYTASFSVIGREDERKEEGAAVVAPPPIAGTNRPRTDTAMGVFLDIDEPYTRRLIQQAFAHPTRARYFRVVLGPGSGMEPVALPPHCAFQWAEYERIDWYGDLDDSTSGVLSGPTRHGASSYCIRKGISRKAQLAHYTHRYIVKNPASSILARAIPPTVVLDCWSVWDDNNGENGNGGSTNNIAAPQHGLADVVMGLGGNGSCDGSSINRRDRLDRCLVEAKVAMQSAWQAFEDSNDKNENDDNAPVWILKGSTTNKGVGIYIVHVIEQVVDHCWNEPDIREWVLQRYITKPLLLRRRKFHIRAYVVAVSDLRVYLYRDCLALCAGQRYSSNFFTGTNLGAHITNTVYQVSNDPTFREQHCVLRWSDKDNVVAKILVQDGTCSSLEQAHQAVKTVIDDMGRIVGELFTAYEAEFGVFAPIDGCFEQYGLDFIVDTAAAESESWNVSLLEVNPGPDFKQTGSQLESVIANLMASTIDVALVPLVTGVACRENAGRLQLVYERTRRAKPT